MKLTHNPKRLVVAFDVDDSLIIPACVTGFATDTPNYEIINLFRWFQAQGHYMIIHSGGGAEYARQWADRLGLVAEEYLDKDGSKSSRIDIAFDDCAVDLATINVQIKRLKNSIVRDPIRARPLFPHAR